MSRWEQAQRIDARIVDGELMLSASDVVAWVRSCTDTIRPACYGPAADAIADALVDLCIEGTWQYVDDGNGS